MQSVDGMASQAAPHTTCHYGCTNYNPQSKLILSLLTSEGWKDVWVGVDGKPQTTKTSSDTRTWGR